MSNWNPDDLLTRPGVRSVSQPVAYSLHPEAPTTTDDTPARYTPSHKGVGGGRASKHRNVPTSVDNLRFDSKGEAGRWQVLCQMQADGVITDLRRQVPFYLLTKDGELVEKYVADFVYRWKEGGKKVIEDFKGRDSKANTSAAAAFRRKVRWMKSEYGHDIIEIRKEKK